MPDNQTVAAVVVTFNRLDFLKEIIESLRNQTRKIDKILVVNNSSTDNTSDWLSKQIDLCVVNQGNVGSSGGQYTGIKTAFEQGYDWIWTMDDDVVPALNCLECLLFDYNVNVIRAPLRNTPDGYVFLNDVLSYNLTNPFRSIWNEVITSKHTETTQIHAVGITFEGPVFHRSIVERIGLPEFDFFIYGDDTEYFIRASKFNADIVIVCNATMNRKLKASNLNIDYGWKLFYILRNLIALDILHGNSAVRFIRPVLYLLRWLFRVKKFSDFPTIFKAFWDGYFYKIKHKSN